MTKGRTLMSDVVMCIAAVDDVGGVVIAVEKCSSVSCVQQPPIVKPPSFLFACAHHVCVCVRVSEHGASLRNSRPFHQSVL